MLLAPAAASAAPLDNAYNFIDTMMDMHAQGTTLRLAQSFVATPTFDDGDISYTYDDAVLIAALLARGTPDDLARAKILGDSLVYAQDHDPAADGRVRDSYHADPFIKHDGTPDIATKSSYTGNIAWTGLALMQLYRATRDETYRTAAQKLASFIVTNAFDTRGKGGFTGGLTASGGKLLWKSTEHNIDCYALFRMLGDKPNAAHALTLVKAMWSKRGGYYFIGTGTDGKTINRDDPTPEDVPDLELPLHRHREAQGLDRLGAGKPLGDQRQLPGPELRGARPLRRVVRGHRPCRRRPRSARHGRRPERGAIAAQTTSKSGRSLRPMPTATASTRRRRTGFRPATAATPTTPPPTPAPPAGTASPSKAAIRSG